MYPVLTTSSLSRFRLFFNLRKKCNTLERFYGSVSDHHNIKRIKLMKRLASTILFGSTFLAIVYAKKRNLSQSFQDAKLVPINPNYRKNFKLYEYKGYILPSFVMKNMDNLKKFICREDDIYVVCFPKTGTTWLQEIVYCIMNGIDKSSKSLEDRFPYLEFLYPGLPSIEKATSQRFIKTHLPYSLLPEDVYEKKPKILCILRNPKDVLVSYYHFVRMTTVSDYKGNFESFFNDFLSDLVPYGPIWKHYNDIWNHRDEPNVLIVSYEDFHKDIKENIRKIANFLEKDLTNQEVDDIAHHCSFENMSNDPNVNYQHWDDLGLRNKNEAKFMRKGEVGDWKNYFSSDMNEIMDSWSKEHFKSISSLF